MCSRPISRSSANRTRLDCFAGKEQGHELARAAHSGSRVRIAFETDVVNDYFARKVDKGEKTFERIVGGDRKPITDYLGPNLVDGRGSITFDLPEETKVGEVVELEFTVRDSVTTAEFINRAKLSVLAAVDHPPGPKPKPKPKPGELPGTGLEGNAGINFPKVLWISRKSPNWSTYFSSLNDCLYITDEGEKVNGTWQPAYEFYLNEDNKASRPS